MDKRFTIETINDSYYVKDNSYEWDMSMGKGILLFGRLDECEILVELLNMLHEENEQLKKDLWDLGIDYYTETYHDNSVRRDEHIEDFKEDFKAKYGDDVE